MSKYVKNDTGRSATGAWESYQETRHFGSLDGLRFLAISAVIIHHTIFEPIWFMPLRRGFLGVDLFFVLSGFLIVTLLLRERQRSGTISLKAFYMRRTLRIFPIYYALLIGVGVLMYLTKRGTEMGDTYFEALPYYLTYTSNWLVTAPAFLSITWSLAAEEQFYMIWPAVEKYLGAFFKWGVWILILGLSQVVNFGFANPYLDAWFGIAPSDLDMLQITFTPIALGVLLAHVLHARQLFDRIHAALKHPWSPVILGAGLAGLCMIPGDVSGWLRLSIQIGMMIWLASLVVREDHVLQKALSWRPIVKIGIISYGMYLFHVWAIYIVEAVLRKASIDSATLVFVGSYALTALIAIVSFRYFETPFLKLKKRFSSNDASGQSASERTKKPVFPVWVDSGGRVLSADEGRVVG